jgi:hypothetical protein
MCMDQDRVIAHTVIAANCDQVPTVEWWTEAMRQSGTKEASKLVRHAQLCLRQNPQWGELLTIAERIVSERGI